MDLSPFVYAARLEHQQLVAAVEQQRAAGFIGEGKPIRRFGSLFQLQHVIRERLAHPLRRKVYA